MVGRVIEIAGFSNLRLIGHGSVGSVYRATRDSASSSVAIKVLREWRDRDAAWSRAQPELRTTIDLGAHPNVVRIEEVIDAGNTLGIVSEYAAGGSLRHLMKEQEGVLTLPQALFAARRIADTLAVAHARGVMHRDLKPTNVLIDSFGQIKVSDYGLAGLARSEALVEQTLATNFRFASPEELSLAPVTPATDVYSLGAILWYVVTGKFAVSNSGSISDLGEPGPELPDIAGESIQAQAEFYALVRSATSRDPSERPDLDAVMAGLDKVATLASTSVTSLPVFAQVEPVIEATMPRASIMASPTGPAAATPAAPGGIHPAPTETQPTETQPRVTPPERQVYPTPPGAAYGAHNQPSTYTTYPQVVPPRSRSSVPIILAAVAALVSVVLAVAVIVVVAGRSNEVETGSAGDRGETSSTPERDEPSPASDTKTDGSSQPTSGTVPDSRPVSDPDAGVVAASTVPETTEALDSSEETTAAPARPDPQVVARDELDALIAADRPTLSALFQRYVPQLSAKRYDWTEPVTGVYYSWPEILADHEVFRQRSGAVIAAPFEFASTENPWFLTLVPTPFDSTDGVKGWCNSNGYVYGDTCVARLIDQVP